MCGRYVLAGPAQALDRLFGLPPVPGVLPRWNVAPGQRVLAVRRAPEGVRRLEAMTPLWGFVPPLTGADTRTGIVNARAETAAQRPSFRSAFKSGRCLVPADGFYEWATGRPKRPWVFRLGDGEPFALGAIAAGDTLAVLTTEPNELVARVHVRMPLIVPPEGFAAWLDPHADVTPLLAPFPAAGMDAYPVSPVVNKADAEGPQCIERDEPPRQGTLF